MLLVEQMISSGLEQDSLVFAKWVENKQLYK